MSNTSLPRYPRPKILDSLPTCGHQVIEASAGTGKTFTIEHLVVDRVLSGTALQSILVVTFTDRAAAELRARIRNLLRSMLDAASRPADESVPEPFWTLDEQARARLADALARIDSAAISTIHAFCQSLLTENAFAHRRLFTQQLTDGAEIFSSVFRDYLRAQLKSDPEFALLLRPHLRGNGFDEDSSLVSLEAKLYELSRFHGTLMPALDADAIDGALALLPESLPSAEELAESYKGRLGRPKITRVLGGILAALKTARAESGAARLLALGGNELLGAIDDGRAIDYALDVLETTALAAAPALRETLTQLSHSLPPADALLARLHLARIREQVRKAKQERGLFDYDDMLAVIAASLDGEAAEAVKSSLRDRYKFALIDEFQDTDPTQWKIFRTLFAESEGKTWLSVIGDPKQAIYGFRAADVETYLGARTTLLGETDEAKLGSRIVRLRDNFRSSERMIRAYNLVLQKTSVEEGTLFQADPRIAYGPDAEVKCGETTVRLVDRDGQELPPVQILRGQLTGLIGKRNAVVPVARYIAEEIERLLAPTGPLLCDKRDRAGRALRADDIFVLARSRSDSQHVAAELAARGLPFSFYKLDGLFQTDEVADLIDLLSAIAQPDERLRRVRAWLTPFFGLKPLEVEQALAAPDDHPLVQRLLAWNAHARRHDFARLFSAILEESGLARRAALLPDEASSLANLQRVLELLSAQARVRHATLPELVALLRAWREDRAQPQQADADVQPLSTDKPAVQLMTMHAAKGLEAAVVFLVGGAKDAGAGSLRVYHQGGERKAWQGAVPKSLRDEVEREQRGEDERLLYVALTRARARMILPQFISTDKSGAQGPAKLTGAYGPLNVRLWHLLARETDPALFEIAMLPPAQGADATLAPSGAQQAALSSWQPPPGLVPDAAHDGNRLRGLARARTGALVTSYSQLARGVKQEPLEVDKQEAMRETHDAEASGGELVSSNVVGNFLHDALELLDLPRVRTLPSVEAFERDAPMRALIEPLADRAGIAPAQRPHAYRLLFAAVRRSIPVGPFGSVPSIAALTKVLRETEFLFPIPERNHRLLGAPRDGADEPFAVGRGFVKGFIDVLFEHEGRVYFGDWKSSVVRDASPAALSSYIGTHFHWQIVVYSVAVLRMLDIHDEAAYERRFGGLLYFFLRNMEATPPGAETLGTWFERPDWTTVKQWERELLQHGFAREERTP